MCANVSPPCVQYLIEKGCDPHVKTIIGETAINIVALSGQLEVVDYLISEHHCDSNTLGWTGRTPIHKAAEGGHLKLVKHLINKYNCQPDSVDAHGDTPLHFAAMRGQLSVIKYLTQSLDCDPLQTDNYCNTALHDAARNGHLEAVKFFVETLHCPIDVKGSCNMTPQGWALFNGHFCVVQYLNMSCYEKAKHIAQVPFLHHELLEVDEDGLEYFNSEHDISIRVLEDTIVKGKSVHLEIAIAMYGPFKFPENTQPVSPILWLCLVENDIELKRPIEITLPHILSRLSKDKIQCQSEFISFAKADHTDYITDQECGQIYYQFNQIHDHSSSVRFEFGLNNYGTLQTSHCCFLCIKKLKKQESIQDVGYSMARVQMKPVPTQSDSLHEFHFYATYDLPTCRKVYNFVTVL